MVRGAGGGEDASCPEPYLNPDMLRAGALAQTKKHGQVLNLLHGEPQDTHALLAANRGAPRAIKHLSSGSEPGSRASMRPALPVLSPSWGPHLGDTLQLTGSQPWGSQNPGPTGPAQRTHRCLKY